MRGKLWFLGGLAAGFVLGARAGREKYDELVQAARKIKDSPTMQEAAGVVQEQATRLYSESRSKVSDKLSGTRLAETKLGERLTGRSGGSTPGAGTGSDPTDERIGAVDETLIVAPVDVTAPGGVASPSTTGGAKSSGL